jgi:hypothetical protein
MRTAPRPVAPLVALIAGTAFAASLGNQLRIVDDVYRAITTVRDMHSLGIALEDYRIDHNRYPVVSSSVELRPLLQGRYATLIATDSKGDAVEPSTSHRVTAPLHSSASNAPVQVRRAILNPGQPGIKGVSRSPKRAQRKPRSRRQRQPSANHAPGEEGGSSPARGWGLSGVEGPTPGRRCLPEKRRHLRS